MAAAASPPPMMLRREPKRMASNGVWWFRGSGEYATIVPFGRCSHSPHHLPSPSIPFQASAIHQHSFLDRSKSHDDDFNSAGRKHSMLRDRYTRALFAHPVYVHTHTDARTHTVAQMRSTTATNDAADEVKNVRHAAGRT